MLILQIIYPKISQNNKMNQRIINKVMNKNLKQTKILQMLMSNPRVLYRLKKNLAQQCLLKMDLIYLVRKNPGKVNHLLKDLGFTCLQVLNFS